MTAFSEIALLVLSFGTLSSWDNDELAHSVTSDGSGAPQPNFETKSLYDLMAHFPTDKDIKCPGSDSRFRYPGVCSRYVTCRNYRAHIRSCPPGMNFDTNAGHCRLAFEVDCEDNTRSRMQCGPDEEYAECQCERTCDSLVEGDSQCYYQCDTGCFCKHGYVRDSSGMCVTENSCGKQNSLFSALSF